MNPAGMLPNRPGIITTIEPFACELNPPLSGPGLLLPDLQTA